MKKLLVFPLGLLAAALVASADEPQKPSNIRRVPIRSGTPGATVEPREPTPINELVIPAEESRVEVRMKNALVRDVLAAYGNLIGKQIVYDNTVQGQITVVSDGAVSKEEATALIETGVFLNGFSLVDSEDGKIVKVIGLGRPVRMENVPIFSSVTELPKRERIVTLMVRLNHVDAQQTAGFLTQYVPPGASISVTPSHSGLLLITAPMALVKTLAKIVVALDVSEKEETSTAEKPAPAKTEQGKS